MPKVGVVALVGRPNVGKSSLVNCLLDYHLSIVTPKPQTTRDNILGLYTDERGQILFVDTPGLHKPQHLLGTRLVERAKATLDGADVVVIVAEANDDTTGGAYRHIFEALGPLENRQVIALVNKCDLPGAKGKALGAMAGLNKLWPQAELLPFSAKTGLNRDLFLNLVFERLQEGELLYPEDQLTDRSERFLAGELIRQCAMDGTEEEVPHSLAVEIEEYQSPDEYPRQDLYVRATLHVERAGQKAILIGKNGSRLKMVKTHARRKLKQVTGWPVTMDLWVKVSEGWREDERALKRLGYGKTEEM